MSNNIILNNNQKDIRTKEILMKMEISFSNILIAFFAKNIFIMKILCRIISKLIILIVKSVSIMPTIIITIITIITIIITTIITMNNSDI